METENDANNKDVEIKHEKNQLNEKMEIEEESINKINYEQLFFLQPSQKNKNIKDFTNYVDIDIGVYNKGSKSNENNKKRFNESSSDYNLEKKKNGELTNDCEIPKEVKELIEFYKDKKELNYEVFEKYKQLKKIKINEDN